MIHEDDLVVLEARARRMRDAAHADMRRRADALWRANMIARDQSRRNTPEPTPIETHGDEP